MLAAAAVSGCSDSGPETFKAKGAFGGAVLSRSHVEPGVSCQFFDGTVRVGDELVLKGESDEVLDKAKLTPGTMQDLACGLSFEFGAVPAGRGKYRLELASGAYPAVDATEQDLRANWANVSVRSPSDAISTRGAAPKVKVTPYNGP